ncbi:HEAT repeat domain-containing protein [Dryocola sp. BD613]|uniref:HEAT repeat domain-containing protein n=1 Tax=Dryocola sp. BD613 TaxID=3133272 RepID=UPI003F4F8B26
MSMEYFLLRQLEKLMAEPSNRDDWFDQKPDPDPAKRLEQLTRHYNGRIRERAVLCLGFMRKGAALPVLIERANDWVMQVRRAARMSLQQFMNPQDAHLLVGCLPNFFALLSGGRDDHQKLVDEIVHFLTLPENLNQLVNGLAAKEKEVSRAALRILLEQKCFSVDVIFQKISRHDDVLVRFMGARALFLHPERLTPETLSYLLKDSYAPVKQLTLQYIIDEKRIISPVQLMPLLIDRNELVRKRAARLLDASGISPVEYYRSVFNDLSRKAADRGAALMGLDEQKYSGAVALALTCRDLKQPRLYRTALHVLVRNLQEDAREYLLEALVHPTYSTAKIAMRQIVKLKLYISPGEIQQSLAAASGSKHPGLYYALANRLSLWDSLIFLLTAKKDMESQYIQEAIAAWEKRSCGLSLKPSQSQKSQLLALLEMHPELIFRDRLFLMQLLA